MSSFDVASGADECPLCSFPFPKGIPDFAKQRHLDLCLNQSSLPPPSHNLVDDDDSEVDDAAMLELLTDDGRACPVCCETFNEESSMEARTKHVNACLDDEGKDPMTKQKYSCPLCDARLDEDSGVVTSAAIQKRITHLKSCAAKKGISHPSELGITREVPAVTTTSTSSPQNDVIVIEDDDVVEVSVAVTPKRPVSSPSMWSRLAPSSGGSNQLITKYFARDAASVLLVEAQKLSLAAKATPPSPLTPLKAPGEEAAASSSSKRPRFWRSKPKEWSNCPASKRVSGTRLIVDGFEYAHTLLSDTYLLSHFHSDHYIGLERSFHAGEVWCTPTTARLVRAVLGVEADRVRALELNVEQKVGDAFVTALDANHCPGSCVFIVRTPPRSGHPPTLHVHTGDFRASEAVTRRIVERLMRMKASERSRVQPSLAAFIPSVPPPPTSAKKSTSPRRRGTHVQDAGLVDTLLIDTTYCDPRYSFQPQDEVIEMAHKALSSGPARFHDTLVLFGTYVVGKEKIFLRCTPPAEKLYADPEKMKILELISSPVTPSRESKDDEEALIHMSRFTADPTQSRHWVVGMHELRVESLKATLTKHRDRFRTVVAVRATGWARSTSIKSYPCGSGLGEVHVLSVPYSEHSSFSELVHFVQAVKPRVLIPTVGGETSAKAQVLIDRLLPPTHPQRRLG